MTARHCTVIGAGLTGATAARKLTSAGWEVTVIEALDEPGGNCRTGTICGITYERCGPHIFHTDDDEVAQFASRWLRPYFHRVTSSTSEGILGWPPRIPEIMRLDVWPRVRDELASRPAELPDPRSSTFSEYVIALMGRTLYEMFIEGYTRKQWDRDPSELSAAFAPKRIDLRADEYPYLFRDRYQGWMNGSHVVQDLLAGARCELGFAASASWLAPGEPVIVTAPLDHFIHGEQLLEWRGMKFTHEYLPSLPAEKRQQSPTMNFPDEGIPWVRRTEPMQFTGEEAEGGIVTFEYPDDTQPLYPVNDLEGKNRAIQRELEAELKALLPRSVPAGRLARYVYIDMDQAIRQGWNAAAQVMREQ